MQDFSQFIREVPDFPKPGILFKDITPLLGNPTALHRTIDEFALHYKYEAIDVVAGPEARGFIFSSLLAYRLGAAFVPIRKKGKLPYEQGYLVFGSAFDFSLRMLTFLRDIA